MRSKPTQRGFKKMAVTMSMVFITAAASSVTYFTNVSPKAQAAQVVNLQVNAGVVQSPFSSGMRGLAYVNWEHAWGKPYLNQVPGLAQATKALKPGVIRYAGGLWANSVGWDRRNQVTPYTEWKYPGDNSTYYFHYGKDEIDDLAAYAKAVGTEVMIQVNVSNNNPAMWADMVKYTNIEKGYGFKYWELGNELDHDTGKGVTPEIYAQRVKAYKAAMQAIDPSIVIIGGVTAYTVPQDDSKTAISNYINLSAADANSVSFHWYQMCNGTNVEDLMRYEWDGLANTSWRNSYSRKWADIIPGRIQTEALKGVNKPIGVTELNADACNYDNKGNSNQFGAVWLADVLGRMAYNGVDYSTLYEGYGEQAYAAIQKQQNGSLKLNSSYYTLLMYSQYFGNQMVQSTSSDTTQLSMWASKDSTDPGTLKLMVSNMSSAMINSNIGINNFDARLGKVYKMTSNVSGSNLDQSTSSVINGVSINANNVVGSISSIKPETITISGNTMNYSFPAYSVTSIVLDGNVHVPSPTSTPTSTPSIAPTASPTTKPTSTPTVAPTATVIPTVSPTSSPAPTVTPTAVPTSTPTVLPTTNHPLPSSTPTPVSGNGLRASYYNNRSLSGKPALIRTDKTINFDWSNGAPVSRIKSNNFSVRWEGLITAPKSGVYTFYARADDGVRLYVNGKRIISDWNDHAVRTSKEKVYLTAGKSYRIKLEYYENKGDATVQLLWSGPSLRKQIIDSKYLNPKK